MHFNNIVDDSIDNLVTDTLTYCTQFFEKHNPRIYRRIIDNCKNIGSYVLKKDYYMPLTLKRMAYQPYRGAGTTAINRTHQEFCTRGRQTSAVIGRSRARSKPALHLAVVLDNSDLMTAWHKLRCSGARFPARTHHPRLQRLPRSRCSERPATQRPDRSSPSEPLPAQILILKAIKQVRGVIKLRIIRWQMRL